MIKLTFCANEPFAWEMQNRNVYIDEANNYISLRRTDGNFNYARAGDYTESYFFSSPRTVKFAEGFYGFSADYDDCILGFRISTDGGESWKYFDGTWKEVGSGEGDMTYSGNIALSFGLENSVLMPGWMSEMDFHEGLPSLSVGDRNIAIMINMKPINQYTKPIFRKITLFLNAYADRFLDDTLRTVSLLFQNNYYFDDVVIQEVDRSTTFQLPYTITPEEMGGPPAVTSCKIVEYVRAFNITNDPNKHNDIVASWTEEGLVTFTSEQEGIVEFQFGNRPTVHIQTDPILQLADEVSIILSNIRVEEWGPYEESCEVNYWTMDSRSYEEQWGECEITINFQAHRTQQVMRMEEGLRRLLKLVPVYSEGTGKRLTWTMIGDVSAPFRPTDQLSLTEVPIRFGRYRLIGSEIDTKLTTDVDYNTVLVERSI